MDERVVLECQNCKANGVDSSVSKYREFRYVGDFTMPGGKEGHVRLCGGCDFKQYFTPEGSPFSLALNRKIHAYLETHPHLRSPR